jgi:hypothetical protein
MQARTTTRLKAALIGVSLLAISPLVGYAASTCSIDPFVTTVSQGNIATTSIILSPDDMNAPFEVELGSMPGAVESGFLKISDIQTIGSTKTIPLVIQTAKDAQIGSFMISVLYRISKTNEFTCQFNLVVTKKLPYVSEHINTDILATTKKVASGTLVEEGNSVSGISNQKNFVFSRNLVVRSKGEDVRKLQELLKALGFFPKNEPSSGYFGTITEKAVKEFQISKHIDPLGIVGPKTRKELNSIPR